MSDLRLMATAGALVVLVVAVAVALLPHLLDAITITLP